MIRGAPRSGKSTALVQRALDIQASGVQSNRTLILTPDRRSARRLAALAGELSGGTAARATVMSYHSFIQDLVRRWWPMVVGHLGVRASTPEFLPFNLAQFACLKQYRDDPGNLQRLTIREQRLIVQVLSNMNLSAGNGLTLDDGWERVALGLGASPADPIIQDGLALTRRFRQCCLEAGVLPVDLQIEAAGWLLGEDQVRNDLLQRVDLLAIDDLDEFVPLMAERLTTIASQCRHAIVTCSDDGGLRWLLGASAAHAHRICDELAENHRFELLHFPESTSPGPAILDGSARWLAQAAGDGAGDPPAGASSIQLHEAHRIDEMAGQVVEVVQSWLRTGTPPGRIALLIPYIDTIVSTELRRLFAARNIPFRVDRRWLSVLDDPLSRACLTALRCASAGRGLTRKANAVEVADLLVEMTGTNPIQAHHWARDLYISRTGGLANLSTRGDLPGEVRLLGRWASSMASDETARPLHEQLELLARFVFAPHASRRRADLIRACYALAGEARRFAQAAPRLGLDGPVAQRFFEYVDSDIVGADSGVEPADDAVMLTTPSVFLTSGRTADSQCWLNVASPSWWEPPLLLLSNPHAMAMPGDLAALTSADDDRIRQQVLGRIIRNLAARCSGSIHAFASFAGPDGTVLEGPLYDCLVEMRQAAA